MHRCFRIVVILIFAQTNKCLTVVLHVHTDDFKTKSIKFNLIPPNFSVEYTYYTL